MKVKIVNSSPFELPSYKTKGAAGMDLRAYIAPKGNLSPNGNELTPLNYIELEPLERVLIPTGLSIELPSGYEAQIRPRSGLAYKKGIGVLNSPGTIDCDYRGDVGVILVNLSNEVVRIENGERIAQMVIAKAEQIEWEDDVELSETQRGSGGFGSTGVK